MKRLICLGALSFALSASAFAQDDDDDVGVARAAACCTTECCNVAGACVRRNDIDPGNACMVCNPEMSQSAYSPIAGCDAGVPATDAGTDSGPPAGTDSGPPVGTDSGPPVGTDSGPPTGMDAGPGTDDGGCSVGAVGATAPLGSALLFGLALLGLRRRR